MYDSTKQPAPIIAPLEARRLLAVTIALPDIAHISINKLAVQSDNKIVVAGSIGATGSEDFFVARLNANGTLDTTFGNQGTVRTDFGSDDAANDVAIDSQGRIVAAGSGGPKHDFAVARYLPNGQLDQSFAHSGTRLIPFGGDDSVLALAITPDNKIILGGERDGDNLSPYAAVPIAKLNADGTLDTTFNHSGTELLFGENSTPIEGFNPISINAMALAPDGKVFLAFDARIALPQDLESELGYVLPDGSAQYVDAADAESESTSIAVTPAETVLLGTVDTFDTIGHFGSFRKDLTALTTFPDPFSDAGITPFQIFASSTDEAIAIGMPSTGEELPPDVPDGLIAIRYKNVDSTPTIDTTYADNGILTPIFNFGVTAIDQQGGLAIAAAFGKQIYVARYTSTGQVDTTFNSTGLLTIGSATITGRVFNDQNANGIFDSTDTGISNFRVFLDANNNNQLDPTEFSTPVSATGTYHFNNVPAGPYHVEEVARPGWRQTFPAAGYYNLNLAPGQTAKNLTFANTDTALIKGTVFLDANKNHKQDAAEPGLAGWYVYIDTLFNNGNTFTLTDSNGNYRFADLSPGTYTVHVAAQSRYTQTTPATGSFTLTLSAGQTTSHKNFGEKRHA